MGSQIEEMEADKERLSEALKDEEKRNRLALKQLNLSV
jgi:hypothetical protein